MKKFKLVILTIIFFMGTTKCGAMYATIINNQTNIICNIQYELNEEIMKINLNPGESVRLNNNLRNLECSFDSTWFFSKSFFYSWTNSVYNFIENENGKIFEEKYQRILDADTASWCSIQ